jgi:N-methylhydantoinase A
MRALAAEGVETASLRREDSLDLRYRGQSYSLNLRWQGKAATAKAFTALHSARYGHDLDLPVELLNLRVRLTAPAHAVVLPPPDLSQPIAAPAPAGSDQPLSAAPASTTEPRVVARTALAVGAALAGPAVILDDVATTYLAPGWQAIRDHAGNLLLSRLATFQTP